MNGTGLSDQQYDSRELLGKLSRVLGFGAASAMGTSFQLNAQSWPFSCKYSLARMSLHVTRADRINRIRVEALGRPGQVGGNF